MPQDPRFIDGEGNAESQEVNFIEGQTDAPVGPFDGLLVVMNMPDDGFGQEYDQVANEAIKDAHAAGWMVMYIADGQTNLHRPPAHYDEVEGMDQFRLFSALGINDEFDYMPALRLAQFSRMAATILDRRQEFNFLRRDAKVIGACKIGGVSALIPLTGVRA